MQRERNGLARAWLERNTRCPLEFQVRAAIAPFRLTGIKLHDLVASPIPRVGDIDADHYRIARNCFCRIDAQIAVGKCREAQPVAEGIERLSSEVAVGVALQVIILEGWQIIQRMVESNRQSARWVVVAE